MTLLRSLASLMAAGYKRAAPSGAWEIRVWHDGQGAQRAGEEQICVGDRRREGF